MIQLETITDGLPNDLGTLRAEALAEGFGQVERLVTEWRGYTTRFYRDGEILLAARVNGVLAGIGGVTIEPVITDAHWMRRFHVRPAFRRGGVGRQLVMALLTHAQSSPLITANAADGSASFWEALGFRPDRRDRHTHIIARANS